VVSIGAGILAGMLAPELAHPPSPRRHRSPVTWQTPDLGGFFARAEACRFRSTGNHRKGEEAHDRSGPDGKITLHSALPGMGSQHPETQEILRKHFEDDDIQTLCIGPAGENKVRFATVSTRHHGASRQGGWGPFLARRM